MGCILRFLEEGERPAKTRPAVLVEAEAFSKRPGVQQMRKTHIVSGEREPETIGLLDAFRNAAAQIGDIARARIDAVDRIEARSEEHTSELQSLMRISYAVFCLKKKKYNS